MPTKVKINLSPTETILLKRKLNKRGEGQRFLTSEVRRLSDGHVPLDVGILKSNVTMDINSITYKSVYAKYQYYGVSKNGKELNYQHSPQRGKFWDRKMLSTRKDELLKSVSKFIGGTVK